MDIITLPKTSSSEIVQINFLKQLSLRVDIKGNAKHKKIQILLFKPMSRPKDDFDNTIQEFIRSGRSLDDVIIFVTVTKPDRGKFEVPENYNFAFQSCVFMNDENEIDPTSSDDINHIADFIKRNCEFQLSCHGKSGKVDRQGSDIELRRENKDLRNTVLQRTEQDESIKGIIFKVERARIRFCGCFFGKVQVTYGVSLSAVEEEISNIEKRQWNFQRKYETKYHLEPGTLRKVLEYIRDEVKNLSGDTSIIEGQGFHALIEEVNRIYGIPEDRFKRLLIQIYKRNDKVRVKYRHAKGESARLIEG